MIHGNSVLKAKPPYIEAVNTVGCGDSMIAGFAYAQDMSMNPIESLQLATAVSAANALQEQTGCIDIKDVEKLVKDVDIEEYQQNG